MKSKPKIMEPSKPLTEAEKDFALAEAYRQMTADLEREREAEEWIEQFLFEPQ